MAALGLALAAAALRVGVSLLPETLPRIDEIGLNWPVMRFALGLALLTGLLCGLAPAFAAIRTSVNETLKEATHRHLGQRPCQATLGAGGGGDRRGADSAYHRRPVAAQLRKDASTWTWASAPTIRWLRFTFCRSSNIATQSAIDEFTKTLLNDLQAVA